MVGRLVFRVCFLILAGTFLGVCKLAEAVRGR